MIINNIAVFLLVNLSYSDHNSPEATNGKAYHICRTVRPLLKTIKFDFEDKMYIHVSFAGISFSRIYSLKEK